MDKQSIYNPVPFLMLSDASLAPCIHQAVTAPPSRARIAWEELPEVDIKAIAHKKRMEEMQQEQERKEQELKETAAKAAPVKPRLPSWKISDSAIAAVKFAANPNPKPKAPIAEEPQNKEPEPPEEEPIDFTASGNGAFLSSINQETGPKAIKPSDGEFGTASGGHRPRPSAEPETVKKRRTVDSTFIANNLQRDVFNHHH